MSKTKIIFTTEILEMEVMEFLSQCEKVNQTPTLSKLTQHLAKFINLFGIVNSLDEQIRLMTHQERGKRIEELKKKLCKDCTFFSQKTIKTKKQLAKKQA
jgi:uncharacterized protein YdcH (DUF465 family)